VKNRYYSLTSVRSMRMKQLNKAKRNSRLTPSTIATSQQLYSSR
jgi:hypothetical protein